MGCLQAFCNFCTRAVGSFLEFTYDGNEVVSFIKLYMSALEIYVLVSCFELIINF